MASKVKRKKVWTGYVDNDKMISRFFSWKKGKTDRTDELICGDTILSRGQLYSNDKKLKITVEEL